MIMMMIAATMTSSDIHDELVHTTTTHLSHIFYLASTRSIPGDIDLYFNFHPHTSAIHY